VIRPCCLYGNALHRNGKIEAARWYREAVEVGRDDPLPALRRAESGSPSR
jgi:hypothetical protein